MKTLNIQVNDIAAISALGGSMGDAANLLI